MRAEKEDPGESVVVPTRLVKEMEEEIENIVETGEIIATVSAEGVVVRQHSENYKAEVFRLFIARRMCPEFRDVCGTFLSPPRHREATKED